MNQTNSHCNSSPASAASLPADAHSPALKAISTLAIQLRAIDSSIDNSSSSVPEDSPQGESCNLAIVIFCLQLLAASRVVHESSFRHNTGALLLYRPDSSRWPSKQPSWHICYPLRRQHLSNCRSPAKTPGLPPSRQCVTRCPPSLFLFTTSSHTAWLPSCHLPHPC